LPSPWFAVGAVIALVARRIRGRSAPSTTITELPSPNLNIVVLGQSGSGKTVLMASLFHQLQTPDQRRPYILDAPRQQRIELTQILSEVIGPGEWPEANLRSVREFVFDCEARLPGGQPTSEWSPILKVRYIDYAGELLSTADDESAGVRAELDDRIDRADGLLLILDGARVLRLMNDRPGARAAIEVALLPLVGSINKARCPAHIVLTKWDMVRDFGEPAGASENDRLTLVRDRLLGIQQIRGLVQERRLERLIPVSAVGDSFATVDQMSGLSVKLPDPHFDPINIEIPFATLIPDLFAQVASQLAEETTDVVRSEIRKLDKMSGAVRASYLAELLSRPAGSLVRLAMSAVAGRDSVNGLLDVYFQWLGAPYRDYRTQRREVMQDKFQQVIDRDTAQRAVFDHFHSP
jgi:hypothetical protein